MPINYLGLNKQINQMGNDARTREAEMQSTLERLSRLLDEHAEDILYLQLKVEEAAAKRGLRCAVPVSEPLNAHIPCSLPAPACTLFAADGSQVNPDPHDTVLYGLVNIGVFCIQPGSGLVPSEITQSSLLYGDALYSAGGTASEDLISLLRDVRERETLAELAQSVPSPVVTLTDGPLELYHEPRQEKQFEIEFKNYLKALDDLAINDVITAGYVSRPRADLVIRLLSLASEGNQTDVESTGFTGLTDTALFSALLAAGERSAIFRLQSRSSGDYLGRKALHFFYLNVGTTSRPAFARVEIPLWVADNPQHVKLLHSVLVEQAHLSGAIPYPYPLIRAHEIAVVKMTDRQQLTRMIESELIRQGFTPGKKSEKQLHKEHSERTRMNR